ncbi:SurA N-terminal domain-containing protein [Candidatus Palauibacter sp.]|uniref:SurA N-terminal domain-containing protein n=1 Tax=Candidatus Palauibacter sp. TaxID=3101350 RepID=UPI003B0260F4
MIENRGGGKLGPRPRAEGWSAVRRRATKRRVVPVVLLPVALFAAVAPASGIQEQGDAPAPDTTVSQAFPDEVAELDRIAAVVGDTAILMSDLRITLYQLQARGARIPNEDSPQWLQFAREVLTAMVDDLIFLQQARIAGVTAGEDRVEEMADQIFAERRSLFSSDEEMMLAVEETGMNMLQYRNMIRAQAEAEALRGRTGFSSRIAPTCRPSSSARRRSRRRSRSSRRTSRRAPRSSPSIDSSSPRRRAARRATVPWPARW